MRFELYSNPNSPEVPLESDSEMRDESNENEVRNRLEEIEPGCVSYCESECNISHFARYPTDVILNMYRQKDNYGPWGVVFVAKADHNGAFYYQRAMEEMHREIGDEFTTRIVEVDSIEDARRYGAALVAQYGEAGFGIVEAHGNPEGFDFGAERVSQLEPDQETKESPQDVLGEEHAHTSMHAFADLIQELLVNQAGLCFLSCSTGKEEDSVGMEIAQAAGVEGVAPREDTNIHSFGARVEGKSVKFDPVYTNGEARKMAA